MMSMIISRLMSKGMFMLMGLGAFAYMIWMYGPMIRIGDAVPLRSPIARAVLILVIFAGWGLYKLFHNWRDKKKSADISKDLAASAGQVGNRQQHRHSLPVRSGWR